MPLVTDIESLKTIGIHFGVFCLGVRLGTGNSFGYSVCLGNRAKSQTDNLANATKVNKFSDKKTVDRVSARNRVSARR